MFNDLPPFYVALIMLLNFDVQLAVKTGVYFIKIIKIAYLRKEVNPQCALLTGGVTTVSVYKKEC